MLKMMAKTFGLRWSWPGSLAGSSARAAVAVAITSKYDRASVNEVARILATPGFGCELSRKAGGWRRRAEDRNKGASSTRGGRSRYCNHPNWHIHPLVCLPAKHVAGGRACPGRRRADLQGVPVVPDSL